MIPPGLNNICGQGKDQPWKYRPTGSTSKIRPKTVQVKIAAVAYIQKLNIKQRLLLLTADFLTALRVFFIAERDLQKTGLSIHSYLKRGIKPVSLFTFFLLP